SALLSDLSDSIHNREVGVLIVKMMCELVSFRAQGFAAILRASIAGKKAARQRAPGNNADAFSAAERNHLALFLAVHQVVMVLHGDKAREPQGVCGVEQFCELPGVH